MNKSTFRLAFIAVLAGSLSGCASSPMRMFGKKQQPFDEYVAQREAEQAPVAGSHTTSSKSAEVSELLHQGHTAFLQDNLQEAQTKYSAVVQRQPDHPVANHRLGVIADRQQDYMTAQRYYFAALNASPNDPNLLNDIGYSFLLQSRYAEAENYLQGALQKNPKQSNAINNLGLLYAKQGQPDRALAMFRMTNSEAEAQAKLTRLIPSGLNAATPAATMMTNQGWPPQNPVTMNGALYNTPQNNVVPTKPELEFQSAQAVGNSMGNARGGFTPPPSSSPPLGKDGWAAPDLPPPNNSSSIAQIGAVSDPNQPESTRQIKEQMEILRMQTITDRQSKDNAERQRQEIAKRQLRNEEPDRANIANPAYSQSNATNRRNGAPTSAPADPNAPLILGPPPSANLSSQTPWQSMPDGRRPANGTIGQLPNGQSNEMPEAVSNLLPEPMLNVGPNPTPAPMPNTLRGSLPSAGTGSPLDTMPTWPPAGSLPAISPNNTTAASQPTQSVQNSSVRPNGFPPSVTDDPARAAARLGMNAGSGNPFPITPGQSSGATQPSNWVNSPDTLNNVTAANGVSPTTPPHSPANSNPPNYGQPAGEPPAGTFKSNPFSTPAKSQAQLPQSQTQITSQDQLPPSEQYQTPNRFGYLPAGVAPTQPSSFGNARETAAQLFGRQSPATPERNQAHNSQRRANTRTTVTDRFDALLDRRENDAVPGTQSVQASTPKTKGHLATSVDDNSQLEYERMIQQLNEETNQIRQQIDEQRQLPGSENFRRSRTQPQSGTTNGSNPRQ